MADDTSNPARPTDPVGRVLYGLTAGLAIGAGLLLAAIAALTTLNIILGKGFGTPIRGEFDFVRLGAGALVFAFLPYCQMVRGNVIVDFLTGWAPRQVKAVLDALGGVLFAAVCGLLAWRMTVGGLEMHATGQVTAVVKLPYWWSFPVAVSCLTLLAIVCLYTSWRDLRQLGK